MLKSKLIFLLAFASYISSAHAIPVVSVRIGKSLQSINVTGTDLKRHLMINDEVRSYAGRKTIKFNCQTSANLNRERNKPILLATLESSTGLLAYDNIKYRGQFKVITNSKGDSCDIINDVPMETYISSLLTKEMNSKWPLEALKAQAVAARTYALHKMQSQQVSKELGNEAYYDLESSEKHQVGGAYYDATTKTIQASSETKGEVLLSVGGQIRPIFFHAKCGGKTLKPEQVWKNSEPSYESVNCPFCYSRGPKDWDNDLTKERMVDFFKWAHKQNKITSYVDDVRSIVLVPDKIDKVSFNVYINGKPHILEKALLRRYFGNVIFPSNSFSLIVKNGKFKIHGEGLGHGVGLCQTGALALAQRGWSYKKILSHYFPGHTLKKLY